MHREKDRFHHGLLAVSIAVTNGDFAQTNTCGSSVPARGRCTISVTFTPSILGGEVGRLTVTDAASNSPQTIVLSGTGERQVIVNPTSYRFTPQKVGTTSTSRSVMVGNNLSTALTIKHHVRRPQRERFCGVG